MVNGANIYDDYGHHPTEIVATAKALMNKKYNKSWVVFQPHTYSRTKSLLGDFAKALLNFDNIIVLDMPHVRIILMVLALKIWLMKFVVLVKMLYIFLILVNVWII